MLSDSSPSTLRSLSRDGALLALPAYPWQSRVAVPVGLVAAIMLLVAWSGRELLLPVTEVEVIPVVMRPAGEAGVHAAASQSSAGGGSAVLLQAAGWIEPDPYPSAIAALVDGTVRDIHVLEGQAVKAGDVVAVLIDDDARLIVRRAEAEVALRRAEYESARQRWDHPIDRDQEVAVSVASLEEKRAELDRLVSEIAAEQARERELADQWQRLEPLAAAQAASAQELQTTRFQLEAQQATLQAMKAQQPVLEAQLRRYEADAIAARQRGELRIDDRRALDVAAAAVQLAETQLAEAQLHLDRTQIRAPMDGVVMTLLVEPGARLMQNSDAPAAAYVARIYDPHKLQVRVDVPLAEAEKISIGTQAEVIVESLPARTFKGEVVRVVHEADIARNTIQFKVRLTETAPSLKPEMLARVRFSDRQARPAVNSDEKDASTDGASHVHVPFIPESIIQREGDSASVMAVDPATNRADRRLITLGQSRHDDWVAVVSGLSAGDVVVASPSTIDHGQRVRIVGTVDESIEKGRR